MLLSFLPLCFHRLNYASAQRPSFLYCSVVDGISDHGAILFTMMASVIAYLSHPTKTTIYLWSQANFQHIREQVSFILCEICINSYLLSFYVRKLISFGLNL